MDRTRGKLYGVSVGPGDPGLLTLKAARCIERCPVIAAPVTAGGRMLALDIAREAAAHTLRGYLDAGQDVAVLNLGDVSIYASFGALEAILRPEGYCVERIAGVPSFCAAAARLGCSLTGGMDEPLTIAPGSAADTVLDAPGTKVLMKSGRQLPAVLEALRRHGLAQRSAMVCSCGLPGEQIVPDLSAYQGAGEDAGYFSLIIVKEK